MFYMLAINKRQDEGFYTVEPGGAPIYIYSVVCA